MTAGTSANISRPLGCKFSYELKFTRLFLARYSGDRDDETLCVLCVSEMITKASCEVVFSPFTKIQRGKINVVVLICLTHRMQHYLLFCL